MLNKALDKALKASSPTRSTPSLIAQMLGTEPPPIAGPSNLPQSSLPSVIFDQEIKSEPDPDWNYQPPKLTGTRCVDFLLMTDWEMLVKAIVIYFTFFSIFMVLASKQNSLHQ